MWELEAFSHTLQGVVDLLKDNDLNNLDGDGKQERLKCEAFTYSM